MIIAKIVNNSIESIGHWSKYPFKRPPSDSELSDRGFKKVSKPTFNGLTQKLSNITPIIDGDYVYVTEAVSLSESEIAGQKSNALNRIRLKRNELLKKCDWTQLTDCQLTAEKKTEWATYRQQLRDITTTAQADGADPRTFNNFPNDPDYVEGMI